jgi:hypothetical protein
LAPAAASELAASVGDESSGAGAEPASEANGAVRSQLVGTGAVRNASRKVAPLASNHSTTVASTSAWIRPT